MKSLKEIEPHNEVPTFQKLCFKEINSLNNIEPSKMSKFKELTPQLTITKTKEFLKLK